MRADIMALDNVAADMAQPELCTERIRAKLLTEVRQQVDNEWEQKCGRHRSLETAMSSGETAMSSGKGGGWGSPASTVSGNNGSGWGSSRGPVGGGRKL